MRSIYGFHHMLENKGCLLIRVMLRGVNFVFGIEVEGDRFTVIVRVGCILCLS